MVIILSILWLSSQIFLCWPHIHLQLCLAGWYCRGCCHITWLNHTSLFLLIECIEGRGSLCPTEIGWSCVHVRSFYAPYRCEQASCTGTWPRMSAVSFLTLSAMSMANIPTEYRIGTTSDLICYLKFGWKSHVALPYSAKSGLCCISRWNLDANFSWACPIRLGLLICLLSFNKEFVDRQCHKLMGCLGWHPNHGVMLLHRLRESIDWVSWLCQLWKPILDMIKAKHRG